MKSMKFRGAGHDLVWYDEMDRELKIEGIPLMKCIFCGYWFAHDSGKIFSKLSDISCICNSPDCTKKHEEIKEEI